ncbi:MAG: sel1 repeat family protein [Gammaproteobacteria bacterium]|nr:sel1 repeat family protein [Gammaproteobacteria bacterium]MBT8095328.1 sel1 repeat family protein [Gammaproteobacteria bacterium]MBT8105526.1 sel1 repeat family protein [Gammaproteobacteria bacterium]NNF49965.1 sel1 repeat family protein [Woeseiaceae bacterium]NNK25540.1 sel1 repeat family protein [Woeseiaceae bacterium]
MRRTSALPVTASLVLYATFAWSGDVDKGWNAYNSVDYATAKAEWQELADSGNASAAYGLGLMYGNGFGVDMDDALAIKYYGIAAEQGHADAQFNMAVMYQNGWGVPQDETKANEWYQLAAEQGNTEAQVSLGRYYALDFLDSYDPVKAYKWFSIAHKLGDVNATDKRDFIASRMTPEQIAEANGLVDAFVTRNRPLFAEQDY